MEKRHPQPTKNVQIIQNRHKMCIISQCKEKYKYMERFIVAPGCDDCQESASCGCSLAVVVADNDGRI